MTVSIQISRFSFQKKDADFQPDCYIYQIEVIPYIGTNKTW